jgi:molybdopterin-guanine dinucleotide biosynthesis protein A
MDLAQVTLAILAGGRGSRMGGPKSHLRIGGRAILEWLLEQFDWPGPTMLVTAPACRNPPGARRFEVEVVDPTDDEGPLRGIHTALASATTDIVLITPVDMPRIGREQLAWLADQLGEASGVMCERSGEIEPMPCALRRGLRGRIESMLKEHRRSVHGLSREPDVRVVAAPTLWGEGVWMNLNTPQDLAALGED